MSHEADFENLLIFSLLGIIHKGAVVRSITMAFEFCRTGTMKFRLV